MKRKELEDIVTCLGQEDRQYYYYHDRFAWDLVKQYCRKRGPQTLKQSRFAKLLRRPIFANLNFNRMRELGSYPWNDSDYWPLTTSFDVWGHRQIMDQTSARQSNLVLQVNFVKGHQKAWERIFSGEAPSLNYGCHPVRKSVRQSLSWARIDFNWKTGEALIEEIQSDWVKKVRIMNQNCQIPSYYDTKDIKLKNFNEYYESYKALFDRWEEITLSAAIEFIVEELAINKIYYHSFETGNTLKSINGRLPPKSLYTKVPKKFCFEERESVPEFLLSSKCTKNNLRILKERKKPVRFFRLEF
ncbi:MAG: hypothetical protein HRU19_30075 [Pseudobacteriovorax sp.]|nr:hypothetical protein [Pseudobacteriovorax sp.]